MTPADTPEPGRLVAANDNGGDTALPPDPDAPTPPAVEAALKLIAQAIGRQLAREAFREMQEVNDNDPMPARDTP
ncbi:MAG: hypothetical protein LBE86_01515 [Gemmobacter sp.]|jgi:hypothetical protein|nr:hypothetical protein [Gemmobacter sp.]